MLKHSTFVPKLHRRVPCRFNCDFYRFASREGVELVRPDELTGDVFQQPQLIVSCSLRGGTPDKPPGQRSKLGKATPRRK